MKNNQNKFQKLFKRWRVKRTRAIIHNPCGDDLELQHEQATIQTSTGSVKTVETITSVILPGSGVKVTSHLQIIGACRLCGSYITRYTARYCRDCGVIACSSCSTYLDDEKRYVCKQCGKKISRKKTLSAVISVLTSPFVERKEQR